MEAVDVLGDQGEGFDSAFDFHQRLVAGVGLREAHVPATGLVEFPDKFGVSGEAFGRGEVFEAEVSPVASVAAEGGDAALGGDSGSGEDGYGAGFSEGGPGVVSNVVHFQDPRPHSLELVTSAGKRGTYQAPYCSKKCAKVRIPSK